MRTIKRTFALVLILGIVYTATPVPAGAATMPFPDMEHSWYGYRDAVSYLKLANVIDGYPDGTFKPRDTINRAEFLKIVFTSLGGHDPVASSCFPDVPDDAWFTPFVCAANRREIIKGYPDGTFRPDQPVNTAEAIKMLLLANGTDITERSGEEWYLPYVSWLDKEQILPSHTFLAWEPLTRERAADLLARFKKSREDRVIPRLSPGCGKSEPRARSAVMVSGIERSYLLTVPNEYESHDPSPLIIAFHGRTNSNEQVRSYFGFDRRSEDFFIAYPAAIKQDNGTFTWSDQGDKSLELRDFAFFDALVEQLANDYCIDMDRIFVAGHSLGAWFANSVACARGGVVRGSATVGGSSILTNCTGPTAALIINNPNDTLSPHKSAEMTRDMRIEENFCSGLSRPADPGSLSCVTYDGCTDNPVTWCPHTIDSGRNGKLYPHLWPDDADEAILSFFGKLK